MRHITITIKGLLASLFVVAMALSFSTTAFAACENEDGTPGSSDGVKRGSEQCDGRDGIVGSQACADDCTIYDSRAQELIDNAERFCERYLPRLEEWIETLDSTEQYLGIRSGNDDLRTNMLGILNSLNAENTPPVSTRSFKDWCTVMGGASNDPENFSNTRDLHAQQENDLKIQTVEGVVRLLNDIDKAYLNKSDTETSHAKSVIDVANFEGLSGVNFDSRTYETLVALDAGVNEMLTSVNTDLTTAGTALPSWENVNDYLSANSYSERTILSRVRGQISESKRKASSAKRSLNSAQKAILEKMTFAAWENITVRPQGGDILSDYYHQRLLPSKQKTALSKRDKAIRSIDKYNEQLESLAGLLVADSVSIKGEPQILGLVSRIGDLRTRITNIKTSLTDKQKYFSEILPQIEALDNTGVGKVYIPLTKLVLKFEKSLDKKEDLVTIMSQINDTGKKTELSSGAWTIDFTDFDGFNYNENADIVIVDDTVAPIQFDTLKNEVLAALNSVLTASVVGEETSYDALQRTYRAYRDKQKDYDRALSVENKKVKKLRGVWYKIIREALTRAPFTGPLASAFEEDSREAKLAESFEKRRDSLRAKISKIHESRIEKIERTQAQVQGLEILHNKIDFANSYSNDIIPKITEWKDSADPGTEDNYDELRVKVRALKHYMINSVYVPVMRNMKTYDRAYLKVSAAQELVPYIRDNLLPDLQNANQDANGDTIDTEFQASIDAMNTEAGEIIDALAAERLNMDSFLAADGPVVALLDRLKNEAWGSIDIDNIQTLGDAYKEDVRGAYKEISGRISAQIRATRSLFNDYRKAQREGPQYPDANAEEATP